MRALRICRFWLERTLARGVRQRLGVIALAVVLISLLGGLAALLFTPDFLSYRDAVWWAFTRLTHPAYLGDDQGPARRLVSTVLKITGYVVFLGALIATLTQWLDQTLLRLGLGLSPVELDGHVVIVGWTSRTPLVLRNLFSSGAELTRWEQAQGGRRLEVVLLVPRVGPALTQELKETLGELYDDRRLTLRSGDPLRAEQLSRADVRHATAVIVPGDDYDAADAVAHDARVLQLAMSLSQNLDGDGRVPVLIAEVFDPERGATIQDAYAGEARLLETDHLFGRLLGGSVRFPGLAAGLSTELTSERPLFQFGAPSSEATSLKAIRVEDAVVVGLVRPRPRGFEVQLKTMGDEELRPGDRVVSFNRRSLPAPSKSQAEHHLRRVLIIGWSAKAVEVIAELTRNVEEMAEIYTVSAIPAEERYEDLEYHGIDTRLVRHVEGADASSQVLRRIDAPSFDAILLLASDGAKGVEADAQTMAALMLLSRLLASAGRTPHVLVELMEPANAQLLRALPVEVVSTGPLSSYVLTRMLLASPTQAMVSALIGNPELEMEYLPASRLPRLDLTRDELDEYLRQTGRLLLGLRRDGRLETAPCLDEVSGLRVGDDLWVIHRLPAR